MDKKLRVAVPGSTSNLGSGFDTLSAAFGLRLTLDLEVTDGDRVEWDCGWDLPLSDNIADVALRSALKAVGARPPGLRLAMSSPIPLKRGLGSSGAAIIAGIKAGLAVAGAQLTDEEILNLALPLEGHPDNIAASLLGGWAISLVDQGRMRAERVPSRLDCRFVLVVPETTVSTKDARSILPDRYPRADAVFNLQRCALFVHALHTGRGDLLREASRDRLHQEYRARLAPGIAELLEYRDLPAELEPSLLSVTISGSGSAVVAIAVGGYEEIGRWMTESFARRGVASTYMVLQLDDLGAQVSTLS
jgi:homoserine kinase